MAAEIRWTEEAAIWLQDIHSYLANDNPKAARRVIEKIYEKVHINRRATQQAPGSDCFFQPNPYTRKAYQHTSFHDYRKL